VLRRRRNGEERGAAAVEFALVSLILITLVGVTFQFAIYLWAFQAASNGAREGARAWAVNPCAAGNDAKVLAAVSPAARPGSTTATAAFAKGSGNTAAGREPGDSVTVTVTLQPRELGFNLVPGLNYNGNIVKTATARVEDVQGCP
jgi:Flp pilus assembly protein TadG